MVLTNILLCRCFYAPQNYNALATILLYVFPGPPDRVNVIRGGCIEIPCFFYSKPKTDNSKIWVSNVFLFVFFLCFKPKTENPKIWASNVFFVLFFTRYIFNMGSQCSLPE